MTENPRESDAVLTIGKRILHNEGLNIGWLTPEVAQQLMAMFSGAQTMIFMQMLRAGMDREKAEASAEYQAPLVAFELGLRVGAELESTRAFREIVGDGNFDFGAGSEGS